MVVQQKSLSKIDLKKFGVIETLEFLLKEAFDLNASDIHIDPTKDLTRLRFRVDGTLREFSSFSKEKHQELISRVKILSGLRIDEHSKAQDGRFRLDLPSEKFIDVRVSILPTYFGENVVLRLLSDQSKSLGLDNLGFDPVDLKKLRTAFNKSNGMILATGPTGCGKTTTLYSIIKELNKIETLIITIEDPIEYAVLGIRQIQVNNQSSLNFSSGLRSILRQDPNIIMVGEIRDTETASMAVNTALTGHLLLSTLHTNDASATLPRLLDMKIEPFLLASTFSISVNQRLVKKICSDCRKESDMTEQERIHLNKLLKGNLPSAFFKGKGCDLCQGSGYKGRTVIAEVLTTSEDLQKLILMKSSAREIKNLAQKEGMTTLLSDGLKKVETGVTTIEEVLRVSYE